MLGDTVDINNLCCNPSSSSEKKSVKPLKCCFFAPEKGTLWAMPKIEKKVSFPAKTAAPLESQQNSVTPLWNEILNT